MEALNEMLQNNAGALPTNSQATLNSSLRTAPNPNTHEPTHTPQTATSSSAATPISTQMRAPSSTNSSSVSKKRPRDPPRQRGLLPPQQHGTHTTASHPAHKSSRASENTTVPQTSSRQQQYLSSSSMSSSIDVPASADSTSSGLASASSQAAAVVQDLPQPPTTALTAADDDTTMEHTTKTSSSMPSNPPTQTQLGTVAGATQSLPSPAQQQQQQDTSPHPQSNPSTTPYRPSVLRCTPIQASEINWKLEWNWTPEYMIDALLSKPLPELLKFGKMRGCDHCVVDPHVPHKILARNITMEFIRTKGGISLADIAAVLPGISALALTDQREITCKLVREVWAPPRAGAGDDTPHAPTSGLPTGELFQRLKTMPDTTASIFAKSLGLPTTYSQWFLGSALVDLCTELEQALRAAAARAPVADAVKAVQAAAGTDWDAAAFLRNQLRLPMPPMATNMTSHTSTMLPPPAAPNSTQLPQARVHLLASPSARLIATVATGDPSPLTHLAGLTAQLPDAVTKAALLLIQQLYLPNDLPIHDLQGKSSIQHLRPDPAEVAQWRGWSLAAYGSILGVPTLEVASALDEVWTIGFLASPTTPSFPELVLSAELAPGTISKWNGQKLGALWPRDPTSLTRILAPLLALTGWDLSVQGVTLGGARTIADVQLPNPTTFWAGLAGTLMDLGSAMETVDRESRVQTAGFAGILLMSALNCFGQANRYAADRVEAGWTDCAGGATEAFRTRILATWLSRLAKQGSFLCELTQDELRDAWDGCQIALNAAGAARGGQASSAAYTPSTTGPPIPTRLTAWNSPGAPTSTPAAPAGPLAACGYCIHHGRPHSHSLSKCWSAGRALLSVKQAGGDVSAFVQQLLHTHHETMGIPCNQDTLGDQVSTLATSLLATNADKPSWGGGSGKGRGTNRSSSAAQTPSDSQQRSKPTGV